VVADAAAYLPHGQFDLILFNESLEYVDDPLELVRRYEPFLAARGLFIASIYRGQDSVRWQRIWRREEEMTLLISSIGIQRLCGTCMQISETSALS
jgi:hypothetical protein